MYLVIIIILILLDQITKGMISSNMLLHESIPVINNIFHITYARNFGAAFSILQNQKSFFIIIGSITIAILIFVVIRYEKRFDKVLMTSLSLITGGAIGNLIDRIRLGYVVDFLDFNVFPVFNIADSSIVCGTILMIIYMLWIEPKKNIKGL